jgi:hypothetical protein
VFPQEPIRVILEQPSAAPAPPTPRSGFTKLKDAAPLITGFGTLLLSVVSFSYVHGLDREKAAIAAADLRQKALAALSEPDATKRDIAAITLAAYGDVALPAIRVLLSGSPENPAMREFGVQVTQRWMDAGNSTQRARLIGALSEYARSSSLASREGAYTALKKISAVLTMDEKRQVLALLVERFGSGNPRETAASVALIACPLLNQYRYSETRLALLNIAAMPDATQQALESYRTVHNTRPDAETCRALLDDLRKVKVADTFQQHLVTLTGDVQGGCSR